MEMTSVGGVIVPAGIELYFTRHATSMENDGRLLVVDAPLSTSGRFEAMKLHGHFDCVVASPLRRCLETLHYSGISWGELIVNPNFRERVYVDSSRLLFEKGLVWELDRAFTQRVQAFREDLSQLLERISSTEGESKKILLVGHSYFFNHWTGRSIISPVEHASIIRLA